jgi:hypothetical protein
MKSTIWSALGALALSLIVSVTALHSGCSGDSCTKDTDCELPLVCVASACVPAGTQHDVPLPDADGDADADADGDADADADGDADDGEADVDADGEVEADGDGGCTAVTSPPLSIAPTTGAADGDERVVALRSGTGFVFFGRPPGPISADGLRFARINLDGTVVSPPGPVWTLSSVDIGPVHPLVELPDGTLGAAFILPTGGTAGVWIKIVPTAGSSGAAPNMLPGTDANSGEPSITYDGTDLIVVWTQSNAGTIEVRGQHVSASAGTAIGSFSTIASGPTGTGVPRILWATGGTRHALAYFNASDGALHVLSLDGTLAIQSDATLAPPAGESFVGSPALAWSGTTFALAWETRGVGSSTLHLATFAPGETPLEHAILSGIALSSSENGQLSLTWAEGANEWGLAWRHARTGRVGISLARIAADDYRTVEGPVDIHPESTTAWYPSIAYNSGTYMFGWIEQSASIYPMYVSTRGCRVP